MSRSGYSDDCNGWDLIRWRGAVSSAIRGKRGQAFLQEMADALDILEAKRLISDELVQDGEVCALGAVGITRKIAMDGVDPYDRDMVAGLFGIAPALAAEIMFQNDDWSYETSEHRFARMRAWINTALIVS